MPLSTKALKDAFVKSFSFTWPSNPRRRRCPACAEWTLFKHTFREMWECCHMEGAELCGYSEPIEEEFLDDEDQEMVTA